MDTKEIIKAAAYKLIETKPFNQIRVKDIIEEAHCSKGTFYRYYTDKYELMAECFSNITFGDHKAYLYNGKVCRECIKKRLEMAKTHAKFLKNVDTLEEYESYWTFLHNEFVSFACHMRCMITGRQTLTGKEMVTISLYSAACVCAFKKYALEEIYLSADELADILLDDIIPSNYLNIADE